MAKAIILFRNIRSGQDADLEVSLEVPAREFVKAVNQAYELGIDVENQAQLFLQMEYPIALLYGEDTLAEIGMRTGSIVYYKR